MRPPSVSRWATCRPHAWFHHALAALLTFVCLMALHAQELSGVTMSGKEFRMYSDGSWIYVDGTETAFDTGWIETGEEVILHDDGTYEIVQDVAVAPDTYAYVSRDGNFEFRYNFLVWGQYGPFDSFETAFAYEDRAMLLIKTTREVVDIIKLELDYGLVSKRKTNRRVDPYDGQIHCGDLAIDYTDFFIKPTMEIYRSYNNFRLYSLRLGDLYAYFMLFYRASFNDDVQEKMMALFESIVFHP